MTLNARLTTALLACCASTLAHGQTVWRCGPDGRVFSDSPCAEGRLLATVDPVSYTHLLQILMLLNRPEALPEPLKALLALAPATDRPGLIAALPRFLQRANNPRLVAQLVEDGVRPYREEPMTRVAARVAMGRAWMEARELDKALLLAPCLLYTSRCV